MTEDQLELEALGWLSELGYTHRCGPDMADDAYHPKIKRALLQRDRA